MIRRQSKTNRLVVDTPDINSCDVFRKCPVAADSVDHVVASVVVTPTPVYPGQTRTITVTLEEPVEGMPLTLDFQVPAGVDNPPQVLSITIQPGQTVGTGQLQAPFELFSGALVFPPDSNPRVATAPTVTPLPAPLPYEVVSIIVNDSQVLIGESVTYTVTISPANAMASPIAFNINPLPDAVPAATAVSIAPGGTTTQATFSFPAAGTKTGNLSGLPAQLTDNGLDLPPVLVVDPVFNIPSYGPSQPLVIAHSGGALLAPEYTFDAYARSTSDGLIAMEFDAHVLSDDAVANWHDDTVDVRTTGTGPVSSFDTASWAALNIDAGVWFGGGFGNTMHPTRIQQLIDLYGTDILYVVEAKGEDATLPILDLLDANDIPKHQVLIASFRLEDLPAAVAEGYQVGIVSTTGTPTEIADALAAGVQWASISLSASDAVFNAWLAAGFKVIAYTANRRVDWARAQALGLSGIFSDDPIYATGNTPLRTTDNFGTQQWDHGMISHLGFWSAVARGRFTAPDYWGFPANGAEVNTVLQGYLSPIDGDANNPSFTLDFSVTFDAANAGDQTRHAIVFIGKNDKAYANVVPTLAADQGFNFVMPKNGNLHIYKLATTGATLVANVPTSAIADGAEAHYRITYAPTGVTLQRLNASGGTATHTANVADTDVAFRGGYVHFGRVGLACRFRNVTVN